MRTELDTKFSAYLKQPAPTITATSEPPIHEGGAFGGGMNEDEGIQDDNGNNEGGVILAGRLTQERVG